MNTKDIDIRLTVDETFSEEVVIHNLIRDFPEIKSAVILRNKGFGHLLPDESTRQER